MLQIFSDAGQWQNITFAATLIFEDWSTQLAFFCKKYEDLESCVVGEIMAIEQGLQWVVENRPDVEEISIYADNISVAQKLCDYADNHTINRGAYTAIWMHMYSLCDHFKTVHVYHVPAHQLEHNPNKACDILCSALLHPYKEAARGGVCMQ